MQYRKEIDGLRAIAVSAVILNHFESNLLPSGFLGVDVFFVISGYVITGSLQRTNAESFIDFLLYFYARRIKRLVPALLVFVALTSVALSLFDPAPQTQLKTGLLSLFGLSNLYLIKVGTNYFGDSALLNSFTHTWSLGVEEQFYLVFPLFLWFLYTRSPKKRLRSSCGFSRCINNNIIFMLLGPLSISTRLFLLFDAYSILGISCRRAYIFCHEVGRNAHFEQQTKCCLRNYYHRFVAGSVLTRTPIRL